MDILEVAEPRFEHMSSPLCYSTSLVEDTELFQFERLFFTVINRVAGNVCAHSSSHPKGF